MEQFKNNTDSLDFSGIESMTDYTFYKLADLLSKLPGGASKLPIDLEKTVIRGTQYVSIWSLHHLYRAVNKSLFDLKSSQLNVIVFSSFDLTYITPNANIRNHFSNSILWGHSIDLIGIVLLIKWHIIENNLNTSI